MSKSKDRDYRNEVKKDKRKGKSSDGKKGSGGFKNSKSDMTDKRSNIMEDSGKPWSKDRNQADKMCDFANSRENDWRWYATNDQLLFDTANIPYSWALGAQLDFGTYGADLNNTSFPGVFAIYTMPTIGDADNANSPVNIASRNIYSYVRHANSGAANYEAPDLMMYLLAMDSCYSFLSWMKRIYGVLNTYNAENRYYPMGIIASMNVDFNDIMSNLANFRAFINVFATKIGSMCVPASMSYFAKHIWMYEGLYLDSVSSKAQTYLFNPYAFLYYDQYDASGTGDSTRGVLKLMPMTNRRARFTYADIIEVGNALINPLLGSEDMNIMSGDILKAFGPSNLIKAEGITEMYQVYPDYKEEVLDQIQNLTMVGDFVGSVPNVTNPCVNRIGSVVVDQSTDLFTGFLTSQPQFCLDDEYQNDRVKPGGLNYLASKKVVTFEYDNITTANTMEATRMCNTMKVASAASIVNRYSSSDTPNTPTTANRWLLDCKTLGSEVACFGRVYWYGVGSNGTWTLLNSEKFYTGHGFTVASNLTTANVNDIMEGVIQEFNKWNILLTKIAQFHRHPALVPVATLIANAGASVPNINRSLMNGLLLDVDKYAIVDEITLVNMSQTALLSEFNVRQYGKSQNFTNILL